MPFDLEQASVFMVIKKDHPGLAENFFFIWNTNVAESLGRVTNGLRYRLGLKERVASGRIPSASHLWWKRFQEGKASTL